MMRPSHMENMPVKIQCTSRPQCGMWYELRTWSRVVVGKFVPAERGRIIDKDQCSKMNLR